MQFNLNQSYSASLLSNEKKIIIQTYSGCGMWAIDHLYPPYILPLDVDDEALGNTILQALANSRTFVYGTPEDKDFFDGEKGEQRYKDWVQYLCNELGCKTKRALLKKMLKCSVYLKNGTLEIKATIHERLEAWSGNGTEKVVLPLTSPSAEIGAALRLALSYCV